MNGRTSRLINQLYFQPTGIRQNCDVTDVFLFFCELGKRMIPNSLLDQFQDMDECINV